MSTHNDGKASLSTPMTAPPSHSTVIHMPSKSTYTPLLERSDSTASTSQVNQRVLVSAVANFSTAYNLAIIGSVVPLVTETNPTLDTSSIPAITACSLVGAIVGQLIFGLTHPQGMILTLLLTVIGAVASAVLPWSSSIYSTLAVCRFVLGIGVGGVYPLSAAAAAEGGTDPVLNNKRVAAVFSFQGWGQLASFLMCYMLLETSLSHEWTWRVLLGLGALPGVFVLHEAITSEETKAFLKSQHNPNRLSLSAAMPIYWKQFVGTSVGWFLFDITFYGNILFTPIILNGLYDDDAAMNMVDIAQFSVFTSLIALPGYYLSYFMMGTMDFKHIQMQGFFVMAILFLAMGLFYTTLLPLKTLVFFM
ncbi:hypothetical protein DYB37_013763 [Aphanomyces astaci]|uniref:Major facilitator superfamily (MFS) profile domain-containing protein n=1 Tax=Aphanomyces astaci TaxID=112090 RepID=A0A418D0U1_APHAT|nr:hypothetical protein DYB35_009143 [Aphanomyces astaci]RHZ10594.1 hypothetical protein DYB37_013763 [Aphanomyces astaci]